MKNPTDQFFDTDADDGALMAELFEAIGFEVSDENEYNSLVEYIENVGERSSLPRGEAVLHGRCLKLGDGLEVWSILYERKRELYYADCRPAFRSRYLRSVLPWELVEYDEDGESIVRGAIEGGQDIIFELQNLTEVSQNVFREGHLVVAMAGLAYWAQVGPESAQSHRFELAETIEAYAASACESDYFISGRVLAWRDIKNPVTGTTLVWIYVDATSVALEVLVNRRAITGSISIGTAITACVWLQGHVLEEAEISARYEGVDRQYESADFWGKLRRAN